jgi:2,3-bisphosphoglycerate-dependent phosphoglycerate mutase
MTTIFFVRHAEPDFNVHDDFSRPLTAKGQADTWLVAEFLREHGVEVVLSSPFKRAVETVLPFARRVGLEVREIADFRERKVADEWILPFKEFTEKQWADWDYRLENGESLNEVQARNIAALNGVLREFAGKTIVIGTHGTALSTIVHYFDDTYGFEGFAAMKRIFPWVVKMTFDGNSFVCMEKIDLFEPKLYADLQRRLNIMTAPDEILGVYDANRNVTGRTCRRGDSTGEYRLVVLIWILNSRGEFLITKRAPNKGFPNKWECTGGSVISGDTSETAAIREVREETGLILHPENGKLVLQFTENVTHFDVWLFRQDFDLQDVVLQEGETVDAKFATPDEIREKIRNGEFVYADYFDEISR